jgi:ceramide glucosyltransferase
MITGIFLILTFVSWIYWLVAAEWTRQFFQSPASKPTAFTPSVSILKPVKGVDPQAFENFVSFCRQDYPCYEILFGVANAQDPAVAVVERLKAQFPDLSIRLFISPQNVANEKAGLLHTLAGEARYPFLVISDSDMRVTPDYLARVIAPLADEDVGLVTCPYRGALPKTFTARLEALHMGVTFLPSVIVARKLLQMHFAMGSTIALHQRDLRRMGGFLAIADYLADDYQIGAHIASLGLKVVLSDYIVASVLGATSFREQWQREVRWSHCTRISRPVEYPGLLLSFTSPLALGFLISSGYSVLGWLVFATSLLERYLVGWQVSNSTNDNVSQKWLIWLPLRDFLSALIWLVGIFGRRVVWRGETYLVRSDGKLFPVRQSPSFSLNALPGHMFARLVPFIDWNFRIRPG